MSETLEKVYELATVDEDFAKRVTLELAYQASLNHRRKENSAPKQKKGLGSKFNWKEYPELYTIILDSTEMYLRLYYYCGRRRTGKKINFLPRYRRAMTFYLQKEVARLGIKIPISFDHNHDVQDRIRQYFNSQITIGKNRLAQRKLSTTEGEQVIENVYRNRDTIPWRPLREGESWPFPIDGEVSPADLQIIPPASTQRNGQAPATVPHANPTATVKTPGEMPDWEQRVLIPKRGSVEYQIWERLRKINTIGPAMPEAKFFVLHGLARVRIARGNPRSALMIYQDSLAKMYEKAAVALKEEAGTDVLLPLHEDIALLWCSYARILLGIGELSMEMSKRFLALFKQILSKATQCPLAGNNPIIALTVSRALVIRKEFMAAFEACKLGLDRITAPQRASHVTFKNWTADDIALIASYEHFSPLREDPVTVTEMEKSLQETCHLPERLQPCSPSYYYCSRTGDAEVLEVEKLKLQREVFKPSSSFSRSSEQSTGNNMELPKTQADDEKSQPLHGSGIVITADTGSEKSRGKHTKPSLNQTTLDNDDRTKANIGHQNRGEEIEANSYQTSLTEIKADIDSQKLRDEDTKSCLQQTTLPSGNGDGTDTGSQEATVDDTKATLHPTLPDSINEGIVDPGSTKPSGENSKTECKDEDTKDGFQKSSDKDTQASLHKTELLDSTGKDLNGLAGQFVVSKVKEENSGNESVRPEGDAQSQNIKNMVSRLKRARPLDQSEKVSRKKVEIPEKVPDIKELSKMPSKDTPNMEPDEDNPDAKYEDVTVAASSEAREAFVASFERKCDKCPQKFAFAEIGSTSCPACNSAAPPASNPFCQAASSSSSLVHSPTNDHSSI